MKLQTRVTAIFDRTIGALAILAGIIIIFIMLSIASDVVGRTFLNRPITWVMEISELSLVALTFLGAAWLLKREGHVKLDIVINNLNPRSQALLNTITSVIGTIICLVIMWYGAKVSWDHFQRGIATYTLLGPPTFPRYAIIAIGSFLMSIQFLRRAYGYWGSRKVSPSKNQRP